MKQRPLDLSCVFRLEPRGSDTFIGQTPQYPWGRIYGGLVVAQALWSAMQTVEAAHELHSLHAYFILGGDLREPVRYEVDRVRNGRSFSTRRVLARQSAGAILTLGCSFQAEESGPETQPELFPAGTPRPDELASEWDAGVERRDAPGSKAPPRSLVWARYPQPLGDDPRLHACALAYVSDLSPMSAVTSSHPTWTESRGDWDDYFMGASLDHAMWFHRRVRADDWLLLDMNGHGLIRSRGLATGHVFAHDGTHVATVAQEALLRERKRP